MKRKPNNPRRISKTEYARLQADLEEYGDLGGIVHNETTDSLVGGNQRASVFDLVGKGAEVVITEERVTPTRTGETARGYVVWKGERYDYRRVAWDQAKEDAACIIANLRGGSWDWDMLAGFDTTLLTGAGFDADLLSTLNDDAANLALMLTAEQEAPPEDAGPQIDRAEALRELWGVQTGDVWEIPSKTASGAHRVVCGDCTDPQVVEKCMQGEKAILCLADPPYGMGKENEGIENDNLYREKLDAFQMQWWRACRPWLADNGSMYIWGQAEDLWRLWYRNLKDSERLTFRNEIVWDKGSGQGMGSEAHRMYPTASERCLFFVIGEQGWNNNADNFWEGFEPLRAYLDGERIAMNWTKPQVEKILGSVNKTQHTFSNSHFNLIQGVDYKKLQAASNGQAFRREYDDLRREYDDLRREWYATRAPFDNTHALMTDVWQYKTLSGDERPDHPTPKPVEMFERIVKTSGTNDAPTLDPFAGSGTTGAACERQGRLARLIEIDPGYTAVILERLSQLGLQPVKVNNAD